MECFEKITWKLKKKTQERVLKSISKGFDDFKAHCFHFFFVFISGFELLFQQAKVSLTVPFVDSQRQVVDKNPIIRLRVLNMTPTANSTVTFKLEENQEFLQLDKTTGQLWFKQGSWKNNLTSFNNIVITAERSDGATARMTLDLHILPVDDVNDFCQHFLCFYEAVTYHVIEDFSDNFKPHEIGDISPKFYGRLCKAFDINYELLNGKLMFFFFQADHFI